MRRDVEEKAEDLRQRVGQELMAAAESGQLEQILQRKVAGSHSSPSWRGNGDTNYAHTYTR